ncbi:hypothetical protein O181_003867 [Austropuccinia psidii MF-1]|uniref:COP9 signalosome complex subunit 5 n=1 Tax=Austropuccinia psidii MF-1 TaxID=1389203 RepID=A0A9Q3BF60_9BASI|nr:hypothetical protein [Austropuccinia psidii MF-1]
MSKIDDINNGIDQTSSPSTASIKISQKNFEFQNNIKLLEQDEVFKYDAEDQKKIQFERKWKDDPHYFKKVKISAIALIKMVIHARSGGQYEIMGLMQGKIDGETFVVMDSFALPVQGTETRVNAASEANEYMVDFLERSKTVGRPENVVGWYHSHPGYGCWLSGIDVSTQLINQTYTDPFVAIVIDPNRTISAGRVEIGAFRTFPEGYLPPTTTENRDDDYQSIPLSKIEDFGAHSKSYYSLEIEHFKSSSDSKLLDLLWNKYWVMTMSQNSLLSNRAYMASQIHDMTAKLSKAEGSIMPKCPINSLLSVALKDWTEQPTQLAKVMRDVEKLEVENQCGLFGQIIKKALFDQTQENDMKLSIT